ncbi:Receptor-type tyrosine-protein phosphatase epsilon-like [Oopsacas minuta]|uniref:Receptor-type tyrosine-protein phosphatase epsilon-like n=1 Tax=Oopsacas minuta TaxID=111878 RepID=A0AAV7K707_9METZ|nr:Receptor-type tyrosine-protein phosphatase epsilon-like [Oopsacas minuta]
MGKTNSTGFRYIVENFPKLSDAELKEGVFIGLQIREVLKDEEFDNILSVKEFTAWKSSKWICENVLGNMKSTKFNEERPSLKDDPRVDCPPSSTDDIHIHQIRQLIEAEPKQSVRILADATEVGRKSVRRILVEVLGLRKVCSVWPPHLLAKANMDSRVVCAQEIVGMIDKYPMAKFLKCWATEDESLVFFDTHLTKTENKAWLAP